MEGFLLMLPLFLMIIFGRAHFSRTPTLREVWRLIAEGGVFEKNGDRITNSKVSIDYVVRYTETPDPKALVEELRIKSLWQRTVDLHFYNGELTNVENVAEELINGQIFSGHRTHFTHRILARVRAEFNPPTL